LRVTTAAPTHTRTNTEAKTREVCPEGAWELVMMERSKHRRRGPHKSQSRNSFRVSVEVVTGRSTVFSFFPTRFKSRIKVVAMGSFRVISASEDRLSMDTDDEAGAGATIEPSTVGRGADIPGRQEKVGSLSKDWE
jgi:hypothetical protein